MKSTNWMQSEIKNILICGYPKSGTTWLTKLTASILNCPSVGFWAYDNDLLVTDGMDRVSPYRCYKAHHLYEELDIPEKIISKIIYIIRDPRDIVVSGAYYFDFVPQYLRKILRRLVPPGPFRHKLYYRLSSFRSISKRRNLMIRIIQGQSIHPPKWLNHAWDKHIESYLDQEDILLLKYEDLLENPLKEGRKIIDFLEHTILDKHLEKAISEQSFETKKKQYQEENNFFTKSHLRKGKTQEWKTELTERQVKCINSSFEYLMRKYDYL